MNKLAKLVLGFGAMSLLGVALADDYKAAYYLGLFKQREYSGLVTRHNLGVGTLKAGASSDFTVTVANTGTYTILAACDDDCDDIDLAIYDANNNKLDEDTSDSDESALLAVMKPGRDYVVRVTMSSCKVSRCGFAEGIFQPRN